MDKLKNFPNQLADFDPYECTALATADLAGNILGIPLSNDFTYAATNYLGGTDPMGDPDGADPWTALQSAVAYGVLPLTDATFTAKTKGEFYCANFLNYTQQERNIALKNQMVAPINLGVNYDGMITWMKMHNQGVIVPLTWFSSFMSTGTDGVIPIPSGTTTSHEVVVYLDDDMQTPLMKPFLGSTFGKGGYGVFTKELYDTIAKDTFSIDVNGNHWLAILAIICTKLPYLYDKLPVLISAGSMNTQTTNGQKLYATAASFLDKTVAPLNAIDAYGVLGCAITLNILAEKAWGTQIGGGYSTAALWECLKDTSKFESVTTGNALPGDIIIAPSGSNANARLAHGHVGIVAKYGILSNNSETGTLEETFDVASWIAYYTTYGGIPTLCYRPL